MKKKADLVIDERLVRTTQKDGDLVVFFWLVNLGQSTAEQDFRVDVNYLEAEDGQPVETYKIPFLREENKVPVFPGGHFDNIVPVPDAANWVEIVIDPDDIVDEETHENNRVRKRIERPEPPREIDSSSSPGVPRSATGEEGAGRDSENAPMGETGADRPRE